MPKATAPPPQCGPRYTVGRQLGAGANGVVWSAKDTQNADQMVAIKTIPNVFGHVEDAKRTLREIKLLRHFNHKNITSIRDTILPDSYANFDKVVLVEEYMETDMHQIIQSKQQLTDEHYQYFLYQVLRGLKALHSADVLHRDLKPGNLLVNSDCLTQICDFGLARVVADQDEGLLTEYVVTRWYRPPEGSYTKAIDIWSVGCIFAELIGGKALFPGKNYIHQLNLILDVLGTDCTKSVMEKIDNERARNFILSRPAKAKVEWKTMFPHATEQALDLLDNMLSFDPDTRYSVEQCLAHPYLATYHDPANPEPTADSLWNEQEFENMELGIEELKKLLWDELQHFKSQ